VVLLVVFALWWRHWWSVWQQEEAQGFWLFIGAGMAGMMVAFVFGMHTLAHEILCVFWIYAAQPLIVVTPHGAPKPSSRYAWLLALVVVAVYISHGVSYLSLDRQRTRFKWEKREGFYSYERWADQLKTRVRHVMPEAQDTIKCDGVVLRQSWACLHPDITAQPVRVTFAIGDVVTNIMVGDHEWRVTDIQVPWSYLGSRVAYRFATDRSWSGAEFGVNADVRRIGVTIEDWTWFNTDGMHPQERWPADGSDMVGAPFRWTGEQARMLVRCTEPYLRIPLLVAHPDVTDDPVRVTVFVNSNCVADLEWNEARWHDLVVFCGADELRTLPNNNVCLEFDVSRVWSPVFQGIPDMRDLGVAVGEPEPIEDNGFYARELWNATFAFRWAGRVGRWAQRADKDGRLTVTYLVDHPDFDQWPVTWRLLIDGRQVHEERIVTGGWRTVTFSRAPFSLHDLQAETDRDWSPQDVGAPDARRLGFAVRAQSRTEP
jgi:hypothetical protein